MYVVVPYVQGMLHPKTLSSVADAAAEVRCPVYFDKIEEADTHRYYEIISESWESRHDFVVVEHDIEVYPTAFREFETCPKPWCVNPYLVGTGGGVIFGLGCTRFREEIMRAAPDVLHTVEQSNLGTWKLWQVLDSRLLAFLREYGYDAHVHERQVLHHHVY